jgi:hypothetical protein
VQDVCSFIEKAPRRMRRVLRGTRFDETADDDEDVSSKRLVTTRTPVGIGDRRAVRLTVEAKAELAERVAATKGPNMTRLFAL